MVELSDLLQSMKCEAEGAGSLEAMFTRPVHQRTILWLGSRFAASGNGMIGFDQFVDMMEYLENIRRIFEEIDVDKSGAIDLSELTKAFSRSGFKVEACDPDVMQQIGQKYDLSSNQVLTFDEFLLLRLEWDVYIDAWDSVVNSGVKVLSADQLLIVLERIKKSLEPVASLVGQCCGPSFDFNTDYLGRLYYQSMFSHTRSFSACTCTALVAKFGAGSQYLTFEQFCVMMEFLVEQKEKFATVDATRSGALDVPQLASLSDFSHLKADVVHQLALRYNQRGDGYLHFDEFLQLMVEWKAETKSKRRLWKVCAVLAFAVLLIALGAYLCAVFVVCAGVFVEYWLSRSHWGEVMKVLPKSFQRLNFRQLIVWMIVLAVAVGIVFLYLRQPKCLSTSDDDEWEWMRPW